MEYSETVQTVWNIDDEILKIIKDLKVDFLRNMKHWNLEEAFFDLILICSECDAKLREEERNSIASDISKLEEVRKEVQKNKGRKGKEKLYVDLLKTYKKINKFMKEHGVWFREYDDSGL